MSASSAACRLAATTYRRLGGRSARGRPPPNHRGRPAGLERGAVEHGRAGSLVAVRRREEQRREGRRRALEDHTHLPGRHAGACLDGAERGFRQTRRRVERGIGSRRRNASRLVCLDELHLALEQQHRGGARGTARRRLPPRSRRPGIAAKLRLDAVVAGRRALSRCRPGRSRPLGRQRGRWERRRPRRQRGQRGRRAHIHTHTSRYNGTRVALPKCLSEG